MTLLMATIRPMTSRCATISQTSRRSLTSKATATRPRHLLSIADLTTAELSKLINNAATNKQAIKSGTIPPNLRGSLAGQTVAMMFAKRSTRTRVSTEAAVTTLGGHPMFLGAGDIQLGVNESLRDTATVISSMTAGIVARVGQHDEVTGLAAHSSVPVINALSDDFHPLQTIASFLTIKETFARRIAGFHGLKVAWIGDSNNVLFDLALGAMKLGVNLTVASPPGYGIPAPMEQLIRSANTTGATLTQTNVPEEAVKGADILVTDTWISMGQEEETALRKQAFAGYQITEKLAQSGGAHPDWKFMHCLPRHAEEVDDAVFYGNRSLVFHEAENRLWSAVSVLEGFIVNRGSIV
ncbi:Ornithine carbamoyltransferase [Podosphaera aphanis]|nr:Ornithine carbamoyltransferase [Podosphaera aphanis]